MAEPLTAAMPPGLDITDGYTVRLTALDPTTGAVVANVKVQTMAARVLNVGDGAIGDTPGFTVTPLLTYEPGVA